MRKVRQRRHFLLEAGVLLASISYHQIGACSICSSMWSNGCANEGPEPIPHRWLAAINFNERSLIGPWFMSAPLSSENRKDIVATNLHENRKVNQRKRPNASPESNRFAIRIHLATCIALSCGMRVVRSLSWIMINRLQMPKVNWQWFAQRDLLQFTSHNEIRESCGTHV